MDDGGGLRSLRRERTRRAIADTAVTMLAERGYDAVTPADIAAAVEVPESTLRRHFPTKEDLVLHRVAEQVGESARVVRERVPGQTPLAALHRRLRTGLDERDPATGLCDEPAALAFHGLLFRTPALAARLAALTVADIDALAEALSSVAGVGGHRPWLLATQFVAVRQALVRANWAALAAGRRVEAVHPQAVAATDDAFGLLAHGAAGSGW